MLSIQRDGRAYTQKQAVQSRHINIGISYAPEPLSSVPNPVLQPKPTVKPGVDVIALPLISLTALGYGTHQRPSQSPNRQLCKTRVARMSSASLIHATLSLRQKATHCLPRLIIRHSSEARITVSTQMRLGTTDPIIRPAASIISVHMDHSLLQARDRSGCRLMSAEHTTKRPAPTIYGYAEPPRQPSGTRSGFC